MTLNEHLERRPLTCPVCGLPMVHSRLHGYGCIDPEHNNMVEAVNAEFQRRLTEMTRPYFEELDNLIYYGDPTDEIKSGRLWERHFGTPDSEDQKTRLHVAARMVIKREFLSAYAAGLAESDNDTDTDNTDKPDAPRLPTGNRPTDRAGDGPA